MQLQSRELRIDLQGEDVALLHEELVQLDFDIPENERAEAIFGREPLTDSNLFWR